MELGLQLGSILSFSSIYFILPLRFIAYLDLASTGAILQERSITNIHNMVNLTCPGRYIRKQVFILLH